MILKSLVGDILIISLRLWDNTGTPFRTHIKPHEVINEMCVHLTFIRVRRITTNVFIQYSARGVLLRLLRLESCKYKYKYLKDFQNKCVYIKLLNLLIFKITSNYIHSYILWQINPYRSHCFKTYPKCGCRWFELVVWFVKIS